MSNTSENNPLTNPIVEKLSFLNIEDIGLDKIELG
jgi:hypothetical protein